MNSHALCKTRLVSSFLCCRRGELNPAISVKCSSADTSWKMQLLFLLLMLAVHSHLLPSSCTWCLFGLVVMRGNSDRKQEVCWGFFSLPLGSLNWPVMRSDSCSCWCKEISRAIWLGGRERENLPLQGCLLLNILRGDTKLHFCRASQESHHADWGFGAVSHFLEECPKHGIAETG